jgi:hypothetical protein
MPDTTLHTIPVHQPAINNIDPMAFRVYSPIQRPSTKLLQLLTVMARTGELPRLSPPLDMQNASYTVGFVTPRIQCQDSNETVRSIIAARAYAQAIKEMRSEIDYTFFPQNLTFASNKTGPSAKTTVTQTEER